MSTKNFLYLLSLSFLVAQVLTLYAPENLTALEWLEKSEKEMDQQIKESDLLLELVQSTTSKQEQEEQIKIRLVGLIYEQLKRKVERKKAREVQLKNLSKRIAYNALKGAQKELRVEKILDEALAEFDYEEPEANNDQTKINRKPPKAPDIAEILSQTSEYRPSWKSKIESGIAWITKKLKLS
ncbi:hypothetical protein HOL34_03510 [bacterium]|jgi:hypothetical protein|nr:hypothetical protein [bacterium]MBT3903868.1 hypothetical protein [bacterium]MBT4577634.1 hypothetical protein [bacterium]MBT5346203.1 hypothetical protein [bacterium]MBT6130999.1 hypothetical protein [bacterium]